ncbi:MAG: hypothetical protein C4562_05290 [Actinobacteria bacterium]|nr:MAG: hypothetical protein C4562_05290 [Actinomycetota bacterium]
MNKAKALTSLLILLAIFSTSCSISNKSQKSVTTNKPVNIPADIDKQKFGFLGSEEGMANVIKENGASWQRPHPGPFLWDSMQSEKDQEIIFDKTDRIVTEAQEIKLGTLATLWPFAEWDQKRKPNADKYKVSENDEFMPNTKEGRGDYLPLHRSNPGDWQAYEKWVKVVVERYDGDGKQDMPGLEIPVKYWEVMNEPDLDSPEPDPRLDFYTEDATAYASLLIKTSKAIKSADPDAKVLIAGAAGGNERFLSFYRGVFQNKETVSHFDIANVHCISNDSHDSFNVEPYTKLLKSFGLNKSVWVTEAEAFISDDPDINATQTYESTKKALRLGAKKIFFTRYEFENMKMEQPPMPDKQAPVKPTISGQNPTEAYRKITQLE